MDFKTIPPSFFQKISPLFVPLNQLWQVNNNFITVNGDTPKVNFKEFNNYAAASKLREKPTVVLQKLVGVWYK
jgi:hypothetical protein